MIRNHAAPADLRWVRRGGVVRAAPRRSTPYTRWADRPPVDDRQHPNETLSLEVHVAAVLTVLRALQPLDTCPLDGCLIRQGEECPACQVRRLGLMS
ncbi:MAG TPA: hypothetical protein VIP06_02890 [Nocardioides sp.]